MRFTEEESKTLETAAAGRPLAAYIRWLIFKEDMPETPKKCTRGETANSEPLPVNYDVAESLNEPVTAIQWMHDTLIKALGVKPQSEPEKEDEDDPQGQPTA